MTFECERGILFKVVVFQAAMKATAHVLIKTQRKLCHRFRWAQDTGTGISFILASEHRFTSVQMSEPPFSLACTF